MMAVASTGKTEWNCRIGWTYGNFIKRVCTLGWTLTGLMAAVLFPGVAFGNREKVFGMAVQALLPSGLIGLMTASMLATVMATCAAFMIDAAALFTENLYKPLIDPHRADTHYLTVARVASLVVTVAGFIMGMTMPSVVAATVHFVSILPFIGVSLWIGIIWQRANRYGAWISTVGSAVVFFGCKHVGWSNAWASLASTLIGIAGIIAGSYLGTPEEPARLARIFRYLEVPVGEEYRMGEGSRG